MQIEDLTPADLRGLSKKDFEKLLESVLDIQSGDRQENQILYYKPASEAAALIHKSKASVVGVAGGNRSSKTESCLVDLIALATGMFPMEFEADFQDRFRGPINIRIDLASLTTVMHPIMLPKLKWWVWTGIDAPGGARGHYGWVPKCCLIDGNWERSWSEKLRTLRILCRNPDSGDVMGESQIQIVSHDQDSAHLASGTFHHILHDECPPRSHWVENRARTWDVNGRLMLAMTWPDDPSIPVDWVFDEIYEKGRPGPNKEPDVDWFELHTIDNVHLDREEVALKAAALSEVERSVRIYGRPIRFSNRIHPLFTDVEHHWCFRCGKATTPVDGKCLECGSDDFEAYCHVEEFEPIQWPGVFLLDPHPRKPHMFIWALIDPKDDIWVVAEGLIDGDPGEVHDEASLTESQLAIPVMQRIIDPNMGRSPSSAQERGKTWQEEFADADLSCDLADDADVGRSRLNEYLKPDPYTRQPRIHVHPRCQTTISQILRYSWDEYRRSTDRDLKQIPRDKYDDFPTLLKYLMNSEPSFEFLCYGAPVIKRSGTRKGAY